MDATKRISVIVPEHVHARLVEMAKRDKRSLRGEIEWLLEQVTMSDDDPEKRKAYVY